MNEYKTTSVSLSVFTTDKFKRQSYKPKPPGDNWVLIDTCAGHQDMFFTWFRAREPTEAEKEKERQF